MKLDHIGPMNFSVRTNSAKPMGLGPDWSILVVLFAAGERFNTEETALPAEGGVPDDPSCDRPSYLHI